MEGYVYTQTVDAKISGPRSFMSPRFKQDMLRYGLPTVNVLAAIALTVLLTKLTHENRLLSVFFFAAVMVSTWYGRIAAGLFATALSVVSIDFFFIRPVGVYWIRWNDLPLLIIFSSLSLVLAYLVDSRRRAEMQLSAANQRLEQRVSERTSELQKANEIKDQSLRMVSHDLRAPLTSILGWIEIMEHDGNDRITTEQGLSTIKRNALMQRNLMNDLLDATGIPAGGLMLDTRVLDVSYLINAAKLRFHPAALEKGVTLEILMDDNSPAVHADPSRLVQVLDNLIANAIKFTPQGGTVRLQVEERSNHLHISISDSGQGISPQALPHVFEEFYKVEGQGHGLGLGLSIVKQIVTAHGGQVKVQSDGLGKGSTFTVTMPCEPRFRSPAMKHFVA